MLDEKIDIKENSIINIDYELLSILLKDRTTNKNIMWATDNYKEKGYGYMPEDEIKIEYISGYRGMVIKPRVRKSKLEQLKRIKDKAEVYTPSWVCNKQNNSVDKSWFGYDPKFNKEENTKWKTYNEKIIFCDKKWEDYVKDIRLEISCGEAPYIVSRYDSVTGEIIDVSDRIGLLDRKIRVVNENVLELNEWVYWVKEAYKSIYAYEWQGDSLLIARENLLYTFADYYYQRYNEFPNKELLKEIAEIISWNLWQMDGIKYVIPNSCRNSKIVNYTLFGEEVIVEECKGCKKNNISMHNGVYAKIKNWENGRNMKYLTVVKGSGK